MKTQQLTTKEFNGDSDFEYILKYADNEYLHSFSHIALEAVLPNPDLNIKDCLKIDAVAHTWELIYRLREIVSSNFDFSNIDFETIKTPNKRQMAKFLFKDNDPAELVRQFDEVLYFALFKCNLDVDSSNFNKDMRTFMKMIEAVQST